MENTSSANQNIKLSDRFIQHQKAQPKNDFIRFEKEDIEQSIPERFEKQVIKYPERLAVKTKDHELTYDSFNKIVNSIALDILNHRGPNEEPVALLFGEGVPAIAAVYGTLKAGKIYVPLQSSHPKERITYMLKDSKAKLLLTDEESFSTAREIAENKIQVINVEQIHDTSTENPGVPISPDRGAYIIYTSGSTGQPKGVYSTHRNLLHNTMLYTNDAHICVDDRQSLLRSYSFNGALKDIFASLLNGASLFPFDLQKEGMIELKNWLIREKITLCCFVATAFRHFMNTLNDSDVLPHVRVILVGAEAIYRSDVELYKKHFSKDCVYFSGFGTSETLVSRRYFINKETQIETPKVPMGYPSQNKEIILLDEEGKKVGFNTIGEIAVKSHYISLGYWDKSELTRERFILGESDEERIYMTGDLGLMMPDGCLMHMGRRDFQVKVRGHRIEIAEIEATLIEMEFVKEVCVMAQPDKHGNQRLVAYIVPGAKDIPNVTALRAILSNKLPEHMIPSIFMIMQSLPLTSDSKINRRALPSPDGKRPQLANPFISPETPLEKKVADIWSEVLDVNPVGLDDNFLELGGNSLLATSLVSRIINAFNVEISYKKLFQSPTVADMTEMITQNKLEGSGKGVEDILVELESISEDKAKQMLDAELDKSDDKQL
ncbi:AMP-binding protein [Candidatus Poribacteria bacterium]|nr:AMP-binding protein [Candidatus Poribacteria bacterium]